MVLCTLLSSPFKALLIAYENIVFISFVEVISCFLKLGIAFYITYHGTDKLIIYSVLLMGISVVEFFIYMIFDKYNYAECVFVRKQYINKSVIRSLLGFAWWTIWSQICIIGRLQGVAIILNRFFGTAVNAAYGISLQVNGVICFVSTSLNNAYSPQIIKLAGENRMAEMFSLVQKYCKYSFLLQSIIIVPLFFFCPIILGVWLEKVPQYSVIFCRMIILTSLADLLTVGLNTCIQATGRIKYYSLSLNSLKLMTIPVMIVLLLLGVKVGIAIATYPLIEFIASLLRIPFARIQLGLDVRLFFKEVFCRELAPFAMVVVFYGITYFFVDTFFEVVVASALLSIIYIGLIYMFALNQGEQSYIKTKLLIRLCRPKY
jgi:putative phospholipid-translocating ATPase